MVADFVAPSLDACRVEWQPGRRWKGGLCDLYIALLSGIDDQQ